MFTGAGRLHHAWSWPWSVMELQRLGLGLKDPVHIPEYHVYVNSQLCRAIGLRTITYSSLSCFC